MGRTAKKTATHAVDGLRVGSAPRQNRMKKLPRITLAEPVIHGVLKIVWDGGYEGIVDLRPTIARGKVFTDLRTAENFKKVSVTEYGHSILWLDDDGYEIDFGAATLRAKAENQARLNEVASVLQY